MSLKRKHRASEGFSMASMTDVIFLLLIFFLVASTVIVPNAIKVTLPNAQQQPILEEPTVARVTIGRNGEFYLSLGREKDNSISLDQLEAELAAFAERVTDGYVSVHADQELSYRSVMEVVNCAAKAKLKVVLATKVTH